MIQPRGNPLQPGTPRFQPLNHGGGAKTGRHHRLSDPGASLDNNKDES